MAIKLHPLDEETLKKTVGRRLRAARLCARISEEEAASVIGHKGITQISLAENGNRLLPVLYVIKLCDAYGVSLDYIMGRVNDPVADPIETNQGAITRSVSVTIEGTFKSFVEALSNHATQTILAGREDRRDVDSVLEKASELKSAYERMKQINPAFEDEIRGAARLEAAVFGITCIAQGIERRRDEEKKAMAVRGRELEIIAKTPQQFAIPFEFPA
jgi:transcriptional regulator with XRE-family HTH domain